MRFRAYSNLVFFILLIASLISNDVLSSDIPINSLPTITLNDLSNSEITIFITKREFPGLNLDKVVPSKFCAGDNVSFSTREFDDSNWQNLTNTDGNDFVYI